MLSSVQSRRISPGTRITAPAFLFCAFSPISCCHCSWAPVFCSLTLYASSPAAVRPCCPNSCKSRRRLSPRGAHHERVASTRRTDVPRPPPPRRSPGDFPPPAAGAGGPLRAGGGPRHRVLRRHHGRGAAERHHARGGRQPLVYRVRGRPD